VVEPNTVLAAVKEDGCVVTWRTAVSGSNSENVRTEKESTMAPSQGLGCGMCVGNLDVVKELFEQRVHTVVGARFVFGGLSDDDSFGFWRSEIFLLVQTMVENQFASSVPPVVATRFAFAPVVGRGSDCHSGLARDRLGAVGPVPGNRPFCRCSSLGEVRRCVFKRPADPICFSVFVSFCMRPLCDWSCGDVSFCQCQRAREG